LSARLYQHFWDFVVFESEKGARGGWERRRVISTVKFEIEMFIDFRMIVRCSPDKRICHLRHPFLCFDTTIDNIIAQHEASSSILMKELRLGGSGIKWLKLLKRLLIIPITHLD
jgi:hypothetical protein